MNGRVVHGLSLYFSFLSAPCRAVLLTINTLDIAPQKLMEMDIIKNQDHLAPWFEKINGESSLPTITDNGYTLWESRAIAKYLVQKYAVGSKKTLYPDDINIQGLIDRLLFFDQGVLYQSIMDFARPQAILNEVPNPKLGAEIERSLQFLDSYVLNNKFILGGVGGPDHLTIADICILASLTQLEVFDYSYCRYEAVHNYTKNLKQTLMEYGSCCQHGIEQAKEWTRSNLKYLPYHVKFSTGTRDDQFYTTNSEM